APAARHPGAAGRRHAPEAADIQEVAAGVVPGPVAADPDDVVAFRLLGRRDLLNRGRRFAVNNAPWPGLAANWGGIVFVDRAASEGLDPFILSMACRHGEQHAQGGAHQRMFHGNHGYPREGWDSWGVLRRAASYPRGGG